MKTTLKIQEPPINAFPLIESLASHAEGALTTYSGLVRNHHQGKAVTQLYYECHPPLAEKMLQLICEDIPNKDLLANVLVVHRYGLLMPGDCAMFIAIASSHSKEALEAQQWMIHAIKTRLPMWKKEFYSDGSTSWIGSGI